jgi:hypothetical protein
MLLKTNKLQADLELMVIQQLNSSLVEARMTLQLLIMMDLDLKVVWLIG